MVWKTSWGQSMFVLTGTAKQLQGLHSADLLGMALHQLIYSTLSRERC